MRLIQFFVICLLCHCSAASCTTSATVDSNNAFALDLYSAVRENPGNLLFSPYSISSALTMTALGAEGNTQQEMQKVLHLQKNGEMTIENLSLLDKQLNNDQLHSANAIWVQTGMQLKPAFKTIMQRSFPDVLNFANFLQRPTEAQIAINQWVANHTQNKITSLLQPTDVTPLTRLVLVSALYMQAQWTHPFKPSLTRDAPFYETASKFVQLPFMTQTKSLPYADFDTFSVLELPYTELDEVALVMQILLPHERDGLASLEEKLDSALIDSINDKLQTQSVQLFIPKIDITNSLNLQEPLEKLGMKEAFTKEADFSGLAGTKDLAIDKAIHKTFIRVDENGTEAAAATAISIGLTSYLPPKKTWLFRADHPFIFIISDKKSGIILFVGRITTI